MPLDPSTLCARTAAGDAELAAPRHGLAIAQRRLLTLLDQPLAIDELAARPGFQPDRLERDLGRLVDDGLVEIHRPAGATGPVFPAQRRSPAAIVLPPPVTTGPAEPPRAASGPPTPIRRIRRGRALVVGFASLVAVGTAIWYVSAPSPGPPRKMSQGSGPADPVPAAAHSAGATSSAAPSRPLEPVRAVIDVPSDPGRPATALPTFSREPVTGPLVATAPDALSQARAGEPEAAPAMRPARAVAPSVTTPHAARAGDAVAPSPAPGVSSPATAAAAASPPVLSPSAQAVAPPASASAASASSAPPVPLAAATPTALDARPPSRALVPLTRESPAFPREALNAGVRQGTVKARLSVDDAGRVTGVDILDAQPRRVFDRAVARTLARWTFEPGASGRTTDVEVAFQRE